MDRFARVVLGYHGAKKGDSADYAAKLLLGEVGIDEWRPSENEYDWLGDGIYFWEHSPERALRWAGEGGTVIGAVIQLGKCLDFTDLSYTELLNTSYIALQKSFDEKQRPLPKNTGRELMNRKLDCLVINNLVSIMDQTKYEKHTPDQIQTVRGAFEEGNLAFPGAVLRMETHIQISVRDPQCILGIFRPNLKAEGV